MSRQISLAGTEEDVRLRGIRSRDHSSAARARARSLRAPLERATGSPSAHVDMVQRYDPVINDRLRRNPDRRSCPSGPDLTVRVRRFIRSSCAPPGYETRAPDWRPIFFVVMADARALEAVMAGGAVWRGYRADFLRINFPERIDLTNADLAGVNLENVDLSNTNLSGTNLYRAFLSRTNLVRADLTGANLYRAHLSGANLHNADLSRANLTAANLTDADLTWATLTAANLYDADLTEADLTDANLTDVVMSVLTQNARSRRAADFLREAPLSTDSVDARPADIPHGGAVRIAIPELPGGMPASELARLSDAIAAIAELSQRVGVELGQRMLREATGVAGPASLLQRPGMSSGRLLCSAFSMGAPGFRSSGTPRGLISRGAG